MSSSMPTLPFIGMFSLSFFKVPHQFIAVPHVSCRYPSGFFPMVSSPFEQVLICTFSFLSLRLPTLEDALLSHIPNDLHKVGRWPNHLLVIGYKVSSLNGFRNET